jgi:hypothetical protein
MNYDIEAIFIDTGNTMRVTKEDLVLQLRAKEQIAKLVGVPTSPEAFYNLLDERYESYKKWTKETLVQVSEIEVWTRWMLPDYPVNQITPLAADLTQLWRQCGGRRVPRPEVKPTIVLYQRSYLRDHCQLCLRRKSLSGWKRMAFRSISRRLFFHQSLDAKTDPYIFLGGA